MSLASAKLIALFILKSLMLHKEKIIMIVLLKVWNRLSKLFVINPHEICVFKDIITTKSVCFL
ncbi:hypothetical protein GCM10023211_09710 [Orbus sasakiae]|uniref:Uncharacterized protein n=1 Tax=Orbus sasakiae TaxID=1078475 RepID=A0ABP9N3A3_9GAMM